MRGRYSKDVLIAIHMPDNTMQESQTSIKIQPVSFAASGAWTVNVWFKRRPGLSDTTNEALGYLMSMTGANTPTADATLANQVHTCTLVTVGYMRAELPILLHASLPVL